MARRPKQKNTALPALLLFDRKSDPLEMQDVADEHPSLVAELHATLEAMLTRASERKHQFDESKELTLSPEELGKLRALGYTE